MLRHKLMADEDVLREIADLLARPKTRSEIVGELLREIAVLLVVFVPLEAIFKPGVLKRLQIAAILIGALSVGYLGIRLEEQQ